MTLILTRYNTLERQVVRVIEESPNVLWWVRNKPVNGWYARAGLAEKQNQTRLYRCPKNAKEELEFVYVVRKQR